MPGFVLPDHSDHSSSHATNFNLRKHLYELQTEECARASVLFLGNGMTRVPSIVTKLWWESFTGLLLEIRKELQGFHSQDILYQALNGDISSCTFESILTSAILESC